MSYLDWKVGDRVVCVDDSHVYGLDTGLVAGKTYEIRAISADIGNYRGNCGRCVIIRVDGAYGYYASGVKQPFLAAARFRKVQPRKTSIACFEAILHGARVPEDA